MKATNINVLATSCVFIAFLLLGCSRPSSLAPAKFSQWIAGEESGLVQSKTVNHVTLRARFLPADYLAYREFLAVEDANFDSLRANYQCGLTFQFSLQADKADKMYGNLMQYDLRSEQDFLDRSRVLSFDIQYFISLQHNGEKYLPVLAQYEGYNAINNSLSFQVVFQLDEFACGKGSDDFGDVTLTFDDPFWNLGKNNFLFEKNNIVAIPKLEI